MFMALIVMAVAGPLGVKVLRNLRDLLRIVFELQSTRFSTRVFLPRFCQFLLVYSLCLLLVCFLLFFIGFRCFCYVFSHFF